MKEQVVSKIKSKVSEEEFEKKQAEFKDDAEALGIEGDDLSKYLVRRWTTYFKKVTLAANVGERVEVEGVVLSIAPTDFGAQRKYDEAKKAYQRDPEAAIEQGLVNKEGTPIHTKGYNEGEPIDVDRLVWQAEGVFKFKQREEYIQGQLTLGANLSEEEVNAVPVGQLLTFEANLNEVNEEDNWVRLRSNRLTRFNVKQELGQSDLQALFDNYVETYTVDEVMDVAKRLNAQREAGEFNYNKIRAVKGDMGSEGINVLAEGKNSDVFTLVGQGNEEELLQMLEEQEGEPTSVTVWLDKTNHTIPRNVSPNALDLYVIGTPRYSKDDEGNERLSINADGLLVPEEHLVEQDSEDITPEANVEEGNNEEETPDESMFA